MNSTQKTKNINNGKDKFDLPSFIILTPLFFVLILIFIKIFIVNPKETFEKLDSFIKITTEIPPENSNIISDDIKIEFDSFDKINYMIDYEIESINLIIDQYKILRDGDTPYKGVDLPISGGHYSLYLFDLNKYYDVIESKRNDLISLTFKKKSAPINYPDENKLCSLFISKLPKSFIGIENESGVFIKKRDKKEYCDLFETDKKMILGFEISNNKL